MQLATYISELAMISMYLAINVRTYHAYTLSPLSVHYRYLSGVQIYKWKYL